MDIIIPTHDIPDIPKGGQEKKTVDLFEKDIRKLINM